ncbi:MAG TPA: Gfo/Idh/MocA family oxidoreductase [Solirubrobacteraceae bacterium]|nr:Gfo/Idh/MocA family oxidoreductase [Solirubrobacteraceae bacterium]
MATAPARDELKTPAIDGLAPARRLLHAAPIGTALVGHGYWGPNLARNIAESNGLRLEALCELDSEQAAAFRQRHPGASTHSDLDAALVDPGIEAIVIATPPKTHYALAKRALEAGKHVLVEKPLATSLRDANELAEIARGSDLTLMPGHTFIYSPAVNIVRELIGDGTVGDVHFVTSARMNLGKYNDQGVVCDLAPHDLSILLYWLGSPIVEVAASGSSVLREDVSETAFMTLTFATGQTANVQISWLAPRKVRQTIVVGSKRMVQYDDTASDEPVRVYDRGMDMLPPTPANFGEHQLIYRTGDVIIPRVEPAEPLRLELEDFANAIRTGEEPRSNLDLGVEIVAAVEFIEESMRRSGTPMALPRSNGRAAA